MRPAERIPRRLRPTGRRSDLRADPRLRARRRGPSEPGGPLRTAGELEQAKASYLASIEALESVRSRLTSEEHKIAFFERRQGPYEALISLLARIYRKGARREDGALALYTSERARGRAMLDLLQGRAAGSRGVDAATVALEADIRARFYSLSGNSSVSATLRRAPP